MISRIFASLAARIAGGLALALLLAIGWGIRLDHLRAGYAAALGRVVIALGEVTGQPVDASNAPIAAQALGSIRDRYRAERNEARQVVARQSASIRTAAAETERLRQVGERDRELIRATELQRNQWITRARNAETRTERHTAEQEAEECNAVLDALYHDGF